MPAHMAVGAVIDKSSRRWWLTIPLAFLSHPLLDYFNWGGDNPLFHGPMNPQLNGVVIAVSLILAIILLVKARRYWLGMMFADIADFEWAFFAVTGWDPYSGLHYKYFYPHFLSTEWGLLVQLLLVVLLVAVVIVPLRKSEPVVDKSVADQKGTVAGIRVLRDWAKQPLTLIRRIRFFGGERTYPHDKEVISQVS
ncbi:MAG: hypothetical protein SVY53_14045 [Chloroflexota bacterium]|nr:hypothetical protein [Chloroflexota bacterium]